MSDDDLIRRGDALALRDKIADTIGARPMSSIHSALCEYSNEIRALPATDARGLLPTNCRKWDFYPIEMPLTKEGQGPAIPGRDEIASITYEVWDRLLNTHASFDNLPDAINEAMRLSRIALENK